MSFRTVCKGVTRHDPDSAGVDSLRIHRLESMLIMACFFV